MRGHLDTPFPIPPDGDAFVRFPDKTPWEAAIWTLPWWLQITCSCRLGSVQQPLRLMSAQIGWRVTLRQIVPRLRCKHCGNRPREVWLVDSPRGDEARPGAKEIRHRLL